MNADPALQTLTFNANVNISEGLSVAENLTANNYLNSSGDLEWIKPENVFDIDDDDIESDLNTYWDIAGDTGTGAYLFNFSNSNLTMDYYFGDGSQLTNLPSGGDNASWNQTLADSLYSNDTSMWEINGAETQLKTADKIDMQNEKIINVYDTENPMVPSDAATEAYVDRGDAAIVIKVLIDTYEGNGTASRELDLGDDYDEIHIYVEENVASTTTHMAEAYAYHTTYGVYYVGSADEVDHAGMSQANGYFQGKMTGADVNKIKLGTGTGTSGSNGIGYTYRIIAKKYQNVQSLP